MTAEPVYKDQVLEVEPTGIEPVADAQRHGLPIHLFGVWFSANAEIATWMVGLLICALYGTDLRSAIYGIVIGNVVGFGLLGVLSILGPKYGAPQMVVARLAFGRDGNTAPAALAFVAGVGWFAINTVFGAYALESITGLNYFISLGIMLLLQIVLAVYGYNLIQVFERVSMWLLAAGFTLLLVVTFEQANFANAFNPHAPVAIGGALAGFIYATALAFSYATGWIPAAADYSRYLPRSSNPRAVWWYSFLGCAVPCIVLEIVGAATVSAVPKVDLSQAIPTDAIAILLGNGIVAKLILATVVLGTLTANCMNLYSGALAALVAFRVQVKRWAAALVVGVLGALIATGGGHPKEMAADYTNFLLLLSYWASPWAAVLLVDWWQRGARRADVLAQPRWHPGFAAWLIGLAASVPLWNQALYTGPIAKAFPQFGDLSYYVGFIVAGLAMLVLVRATRTAALPTEG
jgi:NCS1 family nucleobase:cation symporter-1